MVARGGFEYRGDHLVCPQGKMMKRATYCRGTDSYEYVALRRRKGRETVERVYAITSLPPERADAARLLAIWRGHWGIENRLHWVRDVVFGDD